MASYGTVVCAHLTLDIVSVRLRGSEIVFIAHTTGPTDAVNAPAAVFGEDGRGLFQSPQLLEIPAVRRHQHVTLELPMRIDTAELMPSARGQKTVWR